MGVMPFPNSFVCKQNIAIENPCVCQMVKAIETSHSSTMLSIDLEHRTFDRSSIAMCAGNSHNPKHNPIGTKLQEPTSP